MSGLRERFAHFGVFPFHFDPFKILIQEILFTFFRRSEYSSVNLILILHSYDYYLLPKERNLRLFLAALHSSTRQESSDVGSEELVERTPRAKTPPRPVRDTVVYSLLIDEARGKGAALIICE